MYFQSHYLQMAALPLLPIVDSFSMGIIIGGLMLVSTYGAVLCHVLLRYLIPKDQRTLAILMVNTSLIMMINMMVEAMLPSLADKVGILFPLIMLNIFTWSVCEHAYIAPHSIVKFRRMFSYGLMIILGLGLFGLLSGLVLGTYQFSMFGLLMSDLLSTIPQGYLHAPDKHLLFGATTGCLLILAGILSLKNCILGRYSSLFEDIEQTKN